MTGDEQHRLARVLVALEPDECDEFVDELRLLYTVDSGTTLDALVRETNRRLLDDPGMFDPLTRAWRDYTRFVAEHRAATR